MREAATTPEIKLLLLSGRPALQAPQLKEFGLLAACVDWLATLDLAATHRLFPSLHGQLKSTKTPLSPDIATELKRRHEAIVARNLRLAAEVLSIDKLLRRNDISPIWFKGPVLACQIYGNVSRRQSVDIDVLVPRDRIDEVNELMVENGYDPAFKLTTPSQQRLHEKITTQHSFRNPRNGVWIDVHWGLTERGYSFSREEPLPTVKLDFLGQKVKTFEPGATLCYLCYHGTKHGWNSIGWISDIAHLIQRYPEAVSDYLSGSTAPIIGTHQTLGLGVVLSQKLFGIPSSDAPAHWTSLDPKIVRLSERVRNISLFSPTSADDLIYLGTMTRRQDMALFMWRKLAMPSAIELERVTLPRKLFALYSLLRWIRLSKKYLWDRSER